MVQWTGIEALESRRLFNGGDLDHSFGEAGFAALSKGVAIDHLFKLDNGELLVAGNQGAVGPYVRRLFADGSIDASFTDGGLTAALRHQLESAFAYALDLRGGLLVGGLDHHNGMAVIRITPAGELDDRFGSNGVTPIPLQYIRSITELPDGRAVVSGVIRSDYNEEDSVANEYHGLVMLNAKGKDDKTFNAGAVCSTTTMSSRNDGYIESDQELDDEWYAGLSDGRLLRIDAVRSSASIGIGYDTVDYPPTVRTHVVVYNTDGSRDQNSAVSADDVLESNDTILLAPPKPISLGRFEILYSTSVSGSDENAPPETHMYRAVVNRVGTIYRTELGTTPIYGIRTTDVDGTFLATNENSVFRASPAAVVDTSFSMDPLLRNESLALDDAAIADDGEILAVFSRNYSDPQNVSSFVVKLQRSDAPSGRFEGHDVHAARSGYYFNVHWRDDDGVDASTLGDNDVYAILSDGTHRSAKLVSTSAVGDANEVVATYRVTQPDGQWDASDNGTYEIAVRRAAVSDIHGKFAGGRVIGRFKVGIPISVATTSALPASAMHTPSDASPDLLESAGLSPADTE